MSDHPTHERLVDFSCCFLADPEARVVEAHLGTCGACASLVERLAKERSVVVQALSTPPPAGLARRILDGVVAGRPSGRWTAPRWQVAAAILVFAVIAVFVYESARPSGTSVEVISGQVFVDGAPVARIQPGSRIRVGGDQPATIVMGLGSGATLFPGSEGAFASPMALDRGGGKFRVAQGDEPLRLSTPAGTLTASGAEFSVELRPLENIGGQPMEHLLAMIVAVFSGDVRADVAGKTYALGAGQSGSFSSESVSLNPIQDDDDKEKKDKKKGKKKEGDKKEGEKEDGKKKEKKEKEDKDEKDDDNNDKGKNEKGKQNEKGKNEKGKNDKDD